MLLELNIKNYAVIESLKLEFGDGLCVITGETGAGKSLIVGAISLIIGERGDTRRIRAGAKELIVSARFLPNEKVKEIASKMGIESDEIIITRKINTSGRSYFWVNGTPFTAEKVQLISKFLIDLHGQHSHQLLLDTQIHLDLLDQFLGTMNLRKSVSELLKNYKSLTKKLDDISQKRDEILRKRRLMEFELNELESAKLHDPNEETILEDELVKIEASESLIELGTNISQLALENGTSIAALTSQLKRQADRLSSIEEVRETIELLDTIIAVTGEMRILVDKLLDVEYDPIRAEEIRTRLSYLGDLQQKYSMNLEKLIEYRDDLKFRVVSEHNIDKEIDALKSEIEKKRTQLESSATQLSEIRKNGTVKLSKAIKAEFDALALKNANFKIKLTTVPDESSPFFIDGQPSKMFPTGFERAEFIIRTNPGMPFEPLRKIASGGELSRIGLAIKVAMPKWSDTSSTIFDEIDSGIGGQTAVSVGEHLEKLSKNRQVIVITHLHQIARSAQNHTLITKRLEDNMTYVDAKTLSSTEQDSELQRMLALE